MAEPAATDQPLIVAPSEPAEIRMLTLNRPEKANALDTGLTEALLRAVELAHADGTKALVLCGAGKNFCGGFDFTGYEKQSAGDLLHRFVRIELLLQRLRRGPLVSVALVHGAAYGAGADLAAACTYRVAAPTARFRFPGFQFGVALGTRHLARIVGAQQARSILLANRVVPVAEAAAIGLATHRAEQPDAAAILGEVASAGRDAVEGILRLTTEDTDDNDLADLVRSVSRPGLHERIARYRGEHG
jgi:enoyl-CoA hydratase/carnithine racemase